MFFRLFIIYFSLYYVEAADLWLYESKDNYISIPLKSPLGLLNTSFDMALDTVVFAFGFNNTPDTITTVAMKNAYLELKQKTDINYLLLNWEKEATFKYFGPVVHYPTTGITNAKIVGQDLGDALIQLSNHGLDLDRVHVIGHSLGAQLSGHAGKQTIQNGKYIGRITGLDPAGPLYEGKTLLHPLQKTDATFVMGVHTDPVVYGTNDEVGHVDIWMNCGMEHQPGCRTNLLELCSHARAVFYYAEAINSEKAFAAIDSDSCDDWKAKSGVDDEDQTIYMSENTSRNATGIFYLRTHPAQPYGIGLDGILYKQ